MENEQVLFVFYTLVVPNTSWSYSKIPKGWWWVGSGSTGTKQEEQFQGPEITKKTMITYLNTVFNKLKKKGVIKSYKIRQSYLP